LPKEIARTGPERVKIIPHEGRERLERYPNDGELLLRESAAAP
jgi:hypothetical protein